MNEAKIIVTTDCKKCIHANVCKALDTTKGSKGESKNPFAEISVRCTEFIEVQEVKTDVKRD